jgi:hypothetical protein
MAAARPLPVASDVKSDGAYGRSGTEDESAVLAFGNSPRLSVIILTSAIATRKENLKKAQRNSGAFGTISLTSDASMNRNLPEQHLDLCRKLDQHLRRIEGAMRVKQTESSKRRKTVSINQVQCPPCPIDLGNFVDQLEAYVGWAEENKATIGAALAAKLTAGRGGSDAA